MKKTYCNLCGEECTESSNSLPNAGKRPMSAVNRFHICDRCADEITFYEACMIAEGIRHGNRSTRRQFTVVNENPCALHKKKVDNAIDELFDVSFGLCPDGYKSKGDI